MKPLFVTFKRYFPFEVDFANLTKLNSRIEPVNSVIFACHPHGILATSTITQMAMEPSEVLGSGLTPLDLHCLTLNLNLRIPIWREFLMAFGLGGIGHDSCRAWLKPSRLKGGKSAVAVVPGGAREALYAHPDTLTLVLETRRGFLRLAQETKSLLVPVLCLGENDLWPQKPTSGVVRRLQELILKYLGVATPLLQSWLPRRVPVLTMIGEGLLPLEGEEVSQLQVRYKQALLNLHAMAQSRMKRKLPRLQFV